MLVGAIYVVATVPARSISEVIEPGVLLKRYKSIPPLVVITISFAPVRIMGWVTEVTPWPFTVASSLSAEASKYHLVPSNSLSNLTVRLYVALESTRVSLLPLMYWAGPVNLFTRMKPGLEYPKVKPWYGLASKIRLLDCSVAA